MRPAIFPKSIISLLGLLALGIWLAPAPSSRAQEAATDQTAAETTGVLSPAGSIQDASAVAAPSDVAATDSAGTVSPDASAPEASAATSGGDLAPPDAPNGVTAGKPPGDIMNFHTDLFTGRFTYRVSIIVPPGRGGSQPQVELMYNSSGENGWCGMGWDLDMGYIQRNTVEGVPVSATGTWPPTQYADSKGFSFSFHGVSAKLVNVSGNEWRMEIDNGSFLKFLKQGAGASAYWLVTDKAGNQFTFGDDSQSRMANPKFSSGETLFRWNIRKIVDVNGNETRFTYSADAGKLYLQQIKYNINGALDPNFNVTFNLETRTDTNFTFNAGYRVQTNKRLKEIVVMINATKVRRYALGYSQSPSTGRSLLKTVTQYDSNDALTLPPMTFAYQEKPFSFDTSVDWTGVQSDVQAPPFDLGSPTGWFSIRAINHNTGIHKPEGGYVELTDFNNDGLPDRILFDRSSDDDPGHYFIYANNKTNSFLNYYSVGRLDTNIIGSGIIRVSGISTLMDFDRDGLVDRVMTGSGPYSGSLRIQSNSGFRGENCFDPVPWSWTLQHEPNRTGWDKLSFTTGNGATTVQTLDINNDGSPDHIMLDGNSPFTYWTVNWTNLHWSSLENQGNPNDAGWNSVFAKEKFSTGVTNTYVGLYDLNGDGLLDRVMRTNAAPYNKFVVQFNNGFGFEASTNFGPLVSQGKTTMEWNSLDFTTNKTSKGPMITMLTMLDINGDGLLDRVMAKTSSPYDGYIVQLNTGAGFSTTNITWTGVESQGSGLLEWASLGTSSNDEVYVAFADMNGDGMPDRVMSRVTSNACSCFRVQLNKGPAPDLMNCISNGISGAVKIAYKPSTAYDNRDTNGISRLSAVYWTVSSIVASDGFGNSDTNSYDYAGGYFHSGSREFRGFNKVTASDPKGTKTITYFHQGSGISDIANSEYQDNYNGSKKGIPYRVEVWGNDGLKYKQTINKVEETAIAWSVPSPWITNYWVFPFISQTIDMDYEGLAGYRATAKQFFYDAASNVVASTGNLTNEVNFGEVSSINFTNHTFGDVAADSLYASTAYNNQAKPTNVVMSADGTAVTKLRQTQYTYDTRGNVLSQSNWLNTCNCFVGKTFSYDVYGNVTGKVNEVGITNKIVYEATYQQYPSQQITATFTNLTSFDARSGAVTSSTDPKGLVTAYSYDTFFRLTQADISTTPFGAANLWKQKYTYNLSVFPVYVQTETREPGDTGDGDFDTYAYFDGLARPAQTRAQSEVSGNYRVVDTWYDERGNPEFVTLPYLNPGSPFVGGVTDKVGSLTLYDPIARACSNASPAFMNGTLGSDSGSPVGWTVTAYKDVSTLWTTVVTDPELKVRKQVFDAYNRVIRVVENTATGSFNTYYNVDRLGRITNIVDNVGNQTFLAYDSLDRKTNMDDPDMGVWSYAYDAASRITTQIDAKAQKIVFNYNDPIGRLSSRQLYDNFGSLVATISYTNDIYQKGLLARVYDREGSQIFSNDFRGRLLTSIRTLNVNGGTYTNILAYDDADRVVTNTYPGKVARLVYAYDAGSHLKTVQSVCGTGANETFYTANTFDDVGHVTSANIGPNVTTYTYGAYSKRLLQIQTAKPGGGNHQNLAYTYDKVANVKSITDGVYTFGNSNDLSSITYDDLHRLKSYARAGTTYNFNYDSVGNMTLNGEFGAGNYAYPSPGSDRPHAVTAANGKTYAYDANGCMTNRNGWALSYDQENQLKQVIGTNTVTFGYAYDGARLWKQGSSLNVWIGGIYEIKNGKTLCHVIADGKRIATFEPVTPVCAMLRDYPKLDNACRALASAKDWPLRDGRTPLTVTLIPLLGVLGASVVSRFRCSSRRPGGAPAGRWAKKSLWQQLISVLMIVALFFATTPQAEAATYDPVFYYYLSDNLGSSSIITDRAGNRVDHYENTAYGKERYNENTPAFPVSNRYTGQVFDDDTGLYYYNARYYDAELGRFISPDSYLAGQNDPQDLNPYSYVLNNPLKYADPTGHDAWGTSVQYVNAFSKVVVEGTVNGAVGLKNLAVNLATNPKGTVNAMKTEAARQVNSLDGNTPTRLSDAAKNAWNSGPEGKVRVAMTVAAVAAPYVGTLMKATALEEAGGFASAGRASSSAGKLESTLAETTDSVPVGTKLTRQWGGQSGPNGASWTRDAVSQQSRASLGLETSNTGEFISSGTLINNQGVSSRQAQAWGRFGGGGDEVLVPDAKIQIRLDSVTMPDQPIQDKLSTELKLSGS